MGLAVGDQFSFEHGFSAEDVASYAAITGDNNPIHVDADYAANTRFGRCIVHGLLVTGLFSRALGLHFPGSGTVYVSQQVQFLAPVFVAERVRVTLSVVELLEKGRVRIATGVARLDGTACVDGIAVIIQPRDKL